MVALSKFQLLRLCLDRHNILQQLLKYYSGEIKVFPETSGFIALSYVEALGESRVKLDMRKWSTSYAGPIKQIAEFMLNTPNVDGPESEYVEVISTAETILSALGRRLAASAHDRANIMSSRRRLR